MTNLNIFLVLTNIIYLQNELFQILNLLFSSKILEIVVTNELLSSQE